MNINKSNSLLKFFKRTAFYLSLLIGALMGFLFILIISTTPLLFKSKDTISDYITIKTFDSVATEWGQSDIDKSLSVICGLEGSEIDKAICVQEFLCKHYNYSANRLFNDVADSPESLLKEGGVCRDYAIFYKSVLDDLKINNYLKTEPKHVYGIICIDDNAYQIDQCVRIQEINISETKCLEEFK